MTNIKNNFHDLFRDPVHKGKIISIKQCIEVYNLIHKDNQITEKQLYEEIINQKINSDLRILFAKYDKYDNENLEGYLPESIKRRKKIYDLFGFPSEISEKID